MHYTEIEMAEIFAGYVVVLMRVAICFEYQARPAYLKICIRKFLKPVV